MGSNQQQTDLPQETSPNHVPGNQHFSRDLLIALEGGEDSQKTIEFSVGCVLTLVFSLTAKYCHTQQQTALINLTQWIKNLY